MNIKTNNESKATENVLDARLVTFCITRIKQSSWRLQLILSRYKADSQFVEAKEDDNEMLFTDQIYFH